MRPTQHSRGAGAGRAAVAGPRPGAAALLAVGCALAAGLPGPARADGDAAAATARERAVMMQRFIVSSARIERNPWRYGSVAGFEVLTRASVEETNWELDALRRGQWLQNDVVPKDWRPTSPVPNIVIVDDTDLDTISTGKLHSQPITFRTPDDALAWGQLSDRVSLSTDPVTAYDGDAFAVNSNVHGVDTRTPAYGASGLERVFRSAPPLPRWVIAGLFGQDSGLFRESFALFLAGGDGSGGFQSRWIRKAQGPGTIWVSIDETQQMLKRIKKDRKAKLTVPPLRQLFTEDPPPDESIPLMDSEAGLLVRWGLLGPGHDDPALSKAFLEFVRRARREPVTEAMFIDCFGFGFAAMEERLGAFLKTVLARPTAVALEMPFRFDAPDLRPATADQIGRMLGDWLRMEGNTLRDSDRELSAQFLESAGRMLERAYREDNGLPPDVNPTQGGERSAVAAQNAGYGSTVVMKPFVVSASRIHDPDLLAVYGLYEHDIGEYAKARELLEAAAKAGAVRPRAYLTLARLRYGEAIGAPLGAEGRISAEQAASVLGPLGTAQQYPADPDVYRLIVETWIHSEEKPTQGDLDGIVAGVALFPRDPALAYRSAVLCARSGYGARAAALIDTALLFTTHESNREYFEQLRATLGVPPARAVK